MAAGAACSPPASVIPPGWRCGPGSNDLWTSVNERDELGEDLVPDYVIHIQDGGFHGWPYAYVGSHEDPRRKGERPDLGFQPSIGATRSSRCTGR